VLAEPLSLGMLLGFPMILLGSYIATRPSTHPRSPVDSLEGVWMMILETAHMTVHPGMEARFRTALTEASLHVLNSPGCLGLTVQQGVERPQTFLLLIRWNTLEDHVDGFRGSENFVRWREILGPFFADAPVVEHWHLESV
jgi:heme-degrading monooxygenase HmoA